jgi:hypothetical protein
LHNYIINDRILFNTHSGHLSRLDDPKQQSALTDHAKRLFLRLIDSGYQIVPFDQLNAEIDPKRSSADTPQQMAAELANISASFQQIGEYEPILLTYSTGVQLSTDVELKVISSYRTLNDDQAQPYIAKKSLINASAINKNPAISAIKSRHESIPWYYTRIILFAALVILLSYAILKQSWSNPDYYADYHYQEKFQQCSLFVHNQRPVGLNHLQLRLNEFNISCNTPKNIYINMPADIRRESYQVCEIDPDQDHAPLPCQSFYVVKVVKVQ